MDDYQRKRILITGGAGFLGSHLCAQLLRDGHEVVCVDNFFTSSRDNIAALEDHEAFELIYHDVVAPLHLQADEIYNLACPASPVHYQHDPVHTLRTSVVGTFNLLELARRNRAKILQASTSEVYGDPRVHPQPEGYWGHVNPTGVRACYDEGKRCAETLCMDYHRHHQARIKIARIFNTYGPHMQADDGRVVSNFIVQALRNRPLTVYGDGSQTRSFCYVDDMIDAFVRLMATDDSVTGPVNLGNPIEISVLELAQTVVRLTGGRSVIVFKPLPQDDPVQRRPEISQARLMLGWAPCTPLEQGLLQTIAYFERQLSAPARLRRRRTSSAKSLKGIA